MLFRSVEYGTTDEIFYEPKHEYTKGLLRSIPRLDSKDHERLVPIEGTPVDMLNPPKGCPFAPRCGACMKVCLRDVYKRQDSRRERQLAGSGTFGGIALGVVHL